MESFKMNIDFLIELSEGEPARLKKIITSGINTFNEFIVSFKKSVEVKDLKLVRESSHKIKSIASVIDIKDLMNDISEIKTLLSEDINSEKIQQLMGSIEKQTLEIIDRLNAFLPKD
jgi:hypothetical protein